VIFGFDNIFNNVIYSEANDDLSTIFYSFAAENIYYLLGS
jgi:hypothetical protein